jgi:hypothetical protein
MPDGLTPTELARETGIDRRDVISKCMELGVPIFQGRIDKALFLASLNAQQRNTYLREAADQGAAYFVLLDSSGNMIDSFESTDDAARAAESIRVAADGNHRHFEVVAYDANGDVINPRSPASVTSAG